eukprot:2642980-Amphidinium_carterae.1
MDHLSAALRDMLSHLGVEALSDVAGFSVEEWTGELGGLSSDDVSAALALHVDARRRFERELKRRRLSAPAAVLPSQAPSLSALRAEAPRLPTTRLPKAARQDAP